MHLNHPTYCRNSVLFRALKTKVLEAGGEMMNRFWASVTAKSHSRRSHSINGIFLGDTAVSWTYNKFSYTLNHLRVWKHNKFFV